MYLAEKGELDLKELINIGDWVLQQYGKGIKELLKELTGIEIEDFTIVAKEKYIVILLNP